jgi:hypothetical protein
MRYYSRDYSVVVAVYLRSTQTTFKFDMDERVLRIYVQRFAGLEAVSVGDLTDKRILKKVVAAQLVIRPPQIPSKPPQVIFSKNTIPEQGRKRLVKGRVINGETFVSSVYEQGGDITVRTYHPKSCTIFYTKLSSSQLEKWYQKEYNEKDITDLEKQGPILLLRVDRRKDLYKWAVRRLIVDSRRGKYSG